MYVIIYFLLSHPTRGEWIEIECELFEGQTFHGLTPHGVRPWIEIRMGRQLHPGEGCRRKCKECQQESKAWLLAEAEE